MVTEEEFRNADENAAKAAQNYAKHYTTQKLYESICRDHLSAIKMEIRAKSVDKISEAELETRARASEKWKDFRDIEIEKLRQAGIAQIKYDNAVRRWQTLQSLLSYQKKEIQRFGEQ